MALNTTQNVDINKKHEETKYIFEMLKSGEENIKLSKNKDIVLVLGNTGAGKSTLTQFLTGNNENLISKEVNPDSGEYVIEDTYKKVSSESTILSKTLYPDRIRDPETQTIFYDCPGFIDTRSPAHDISATFFVKKVIDFSRKVKLVFVVNYSSVRKGVDRNDFMLLVSHATTLLKDINKYKNSIALVVTKVDNKYIRKGNTFRLVPDEVVIASIVDFIKSVKHDIKNLLESLENHPKNRQFYEKALNFIDIILESEGQHYKKIGIFRRPDQSGPLSQNKMLQDAKKSLKKIIHKNIIYIEKGVDDFGYSISAQSKNYVYDLGGEINKCVASELAKIGKEVTEYFKIEEKKTIDIFRLYNKFKSGVIILEKFELKKYNPEKGFLEEIIKSLEELDINISSENILNIMSYLSYLKFLEEVSNKSTINPTEWSQGLSELNGYLGFSQKWYNFLINLYNWLSDYSIQRDIIHYNNIASKLIKQCMIGKNHYIKINETDLNLFLNKVKIKTQNNNIEKEYSEIHEYTVDHTKLEALKRVLNLTMNHKVETLCKEPNKMVMKGQFIKLSDIQWYKCPQKIKFIELFAISKVFIDTNIDKNGDKLQMSIIAPSWDVIGDRTIVLDGKSGESQRKARDGTHIEERGYNGQPGLPGGASGNFLGIAGSVTGGQLNIFANGGTGGKGQDGGDGAVGRRGDNAPSASGSRVRTVFNSWGPEEDWNGKVKWEYRENKKEYVLVAWYFYKAEGTKATRGGDGGDGGAGGRGGNKGTIKVIDLSNSGKIYLFSRDGAEGPGGRGGDGGHGAENGYTLDAECRINRWVIIATTSCRNERLQYAGHSPSGLQGRSGTNYSGRKDPESATYLVKPAFTINNFKSYMRENLSSSLEKSLLIEFQNKFENTEKVLNLYDTLSLVNELEGLEKSLLNSERKTLVLPFYRSLLTRIEKYASKPKDIEANKEYKRVLSTLYTATLSKFFTLADDLKNYMVLDVPKYFDIVCDNIKKLKELSNNVAILEHKKQYILEIENQINNVNLILNKKAMPEINNILEEIDNKAHSLINDTLLEIHKTEEEENRWYERQHELEQSMLLRMILVPINMISEFLGFLGPSAEGITRLIEGFATVTEAMNFGESNDNKFNIQPLILSLVGSLGRTLEKMNDVGRGNEELLTTQLYDVSSVLLKYIGAEQTHKDILNGTYDKIQTVTDKLKEATENKFLLDSETVDKLRSEVSTQLKSQTGKLVNGELSEEGTKLKKDLLGVQEFLNISDISPELYRHIRSDEKQVHLIKESIHNLEEKKRKLKKFENNIYNIIIPKCKELWSILNNFKNNLSNSSHVELEIREWEIQKTMKEIKFEVQQLTKHLDLGEELIHSFDKLIEAMTYIINIYDTLNDYTDKSKLAAYIADVSSSTALGIKISSEELQDALRSLDLIIKSNLVLEEYNRAIGAFTQYIFPFADLYLDEFYLPSSLFLENDTDSLLQTAIHKIEKIQLNIEKSLISVNKYDEFIHKNIIFSSNSNHSSPFYIWKNSINKNTIKNLMNGGEVIIKSDITRGVNKNAVKFNTIGINFKTLNDTVQIDLNNDLKKYQVIMTHFGNSYFKCGNKYYMITSNKLTFIYHWARNMDGEPIDTNVVYDKVRSNDYMLSPYALWGIQLSNENMDFSPLKKYENEIIDIELEGRGQYIDEDAVEMEICNKEMEDYYIPEESISKQNSISMMLEDTIDNEEVISTANYYSSQIVSDFPPVPNSGKSYFKSSFMNNIFASIISGTNVFKLLNPFIENSNYMGKLNFDSFSKWFSFSKTWETNNSNGEYIEENTSLHSVDNSPLMSHSNLMLWDLFLRKYNKNHHKIYQSYNEEISEKMKMTEFSHNLAYNYYAPTKIRSNNELAREYHTESRILNDSRTLFPPNLAVLNKNMKSEIIKIPNNNTQLELL